MPGLRSNDQVVEIDGRDVDNFDALVKIIETKEPGERVSVVYRRGSEIHEAVAELLPWAPAKFPKPKP